MNFPTQERVAPRKKSLFVVGLVLTLGLVVHSLSAYLDEFMSEDGRNEERVRTAWNDALQAFSRGDWEEVLSLADRANTLGEGALSAARDGLVAASLYEVARVSLAALESMPAQRDASGAPRRATRHWRQALSASARISSSVCRSPPR